MVTKLRLVLTTTIVFFSFYGLAQNAYWKQDATAKVIATAGLQRADYKKAAYFSLNREAFERSLPTSAPYQSASIVYFPDESGELIAYKVTPSPVMAPELAARYPGIRSFTGRGLHRPEERIRFSISHKGIQSMMVHAGKIRNTFMQKVDGTDNQYLLYQRDELPGAALDFICYTFSALQKQVSAGTFKLVDDQLLRRYRIAVSATGEYTRFHGGTKADALAAINATLTRVNEVFETDLGISLQLIAGTDQVIFLDPDTDPYGSNLNVEVQTTLSSNIGEANYDVGHLFHQDSDAGNAGFIGSVCKDNQKGSAFSSGLIPQGDVFDLDFVAHELGHQFGANHTWSFESEGTQVQAEPGSGSTIMGYAGIVDGNNVQPNGDDYFHYFSILQITDYLQTISCGESIPLTNNPPVISPAGDYIIPKGTAFVLTGDASDPDSTDVLTYCWEQIDDGVVTAGTFGPTNANGANFRSRKPELSPSRYFPMLQEVLAGNLTQTNPVVSSAWETVSLVERDLHFALTVRDNAAGGGQVASDLSQVRVRNNAGPFVVTSQGLGEVYPAGSIQTITWEVAGTNAGLVNTQEVDIFLSTDGGQTFPIQLANGRPNNGSAEVLIPGTATATARFMVKGHNNIFFAVNAADFSIQESAVVLGFTELEYKVCQPDSLLIPFSFETFGGFNEEVTFSASGLPPELAVTFEPDTVIANTNPVNLSIANTDLATAGNYPFVVTATSMSQSKAVELQLRILDGSFSPVALSLPVDGASEVSLNTMLSWIGDAAYTSYDIEIATDSVFTAIVENANVIFNSYSPKSLQQDSTYYWRVKPLNICGEGSFSPPFSFTTIAINCQEKSASDLPISISSVGTPTIESTISFLDDLPVADVNVTVNIDHTFLGDLVISLISPSGTEVVLTANSCGEFADLDAVFDDEASPFICSDNPAISGTVKPLGSLASFIGESAFGEWTLRVADTAPADGGALNTFKLEICVEGDFRPDADEDGVFDDGDDLCLGTPKGAEVDINGCRVYRFDPQNFTVGITSESCIPNNNGSIEITATELLDYTVTVSGPGGVDETDTFTTGYQLGGLASGTYSLCIEGTNGINVYQPYCFEVVISQPEPLSVVTAVSPDGQQATLQLDGADLYLVELNGVQQQVSEPELILDLKAGENTLKVSTLQPCQGQYREEIYRFGQAVLYPNPVEDELRIRTAAALGPVTVSIFGMDGRFIEMKVFPMDAGELLVDFSDKPAGVYLIRVEGTGVKGTYKVVKR